MCVVRRSPGTARSCQLITRDGRLVRARDVEGVEVSPPNGAYTHAHASYRMCQLFLVVVQSPCFINVIAESGALTVVSSRSEPAAAPLRRGNRSRSRDKAEGRSRSSHYAARMSAVSGEAYSHRYSLGTVTKCANFDFLEINNSNRYTRERAPARASGRRRARAADSREARRRRRALGLSPISEWRRGARGRGAG